MIKDQVIKEFYQLVYSAYMDFNIDLRDAVQDAVLDSPEDLRDYMVLLHVQDLLTEAHTEMRRLYKPQIQPLGHKKNLA